jgi:hypothetical protein
MDAGLPNLQRARYKRNSRWWQPLSQPKRDPLVVGALENVFGEILSYWSSVPARLYLMMILVIRWRMVKAFVIDIAASDAQFCCSRIVCPRRSSHRTTRSSLEALVYIRPSGFRQDRTLQLGQPN